MIRIFLIFLGTILLLGCDNKINELQNTCHSNLETNATLNDEALHAELKELKRIVNETGSSKCCQKYIEQVIIEGSSVLNLKAGIMDGGYAYGEDVKKIASYVLTLSNREPVYPQYLEEGNMLYNGNCGGCHGDDGKGLGGAYPDLTLPLFKGAEIRRENTIQKIQKLEDELLKVNNVK